MNSQSRLSDLFHPTTLPEVFEKWRAGAWVVKHGAHELVAPMSSLPELQDLDALLRVARGTINAFMVGRDDDVVLLPQLRALQARRLFDVGATIVFPDLEKSVPRVREFGDEVGRAVGARPETVSCIAFVSAPEAKLSFNWHFDPFETLVVQLSGTKRWTLRSNPAAPFPIHAYPLNGRERRSPYMAYIPADLSERSGQEEEVVVMQPGSVLFNPRGAWHQTGGVGEDMSLSLSFTLYTDTWQAVLRHALDLTLSQRVPWREPAMGLWSDGEMHAGARARFAALLGALKDELSRATVEEIVQRYFDAVGAPGGGAPDRER